MKEKWKNILERYGTIALVIYLVTFVVTFVAIYSLIEFGFEDSIVSFFEEHLGEKYSSAGTLVVAYALTKATQPIRIGITILLVPIVASKKTNP
jgi:hypothetical protein